MKITRRQGDTDETFAYYSDLTALDFTDSKDTARQEFKDEADINVMLSRFGINQQQRTMQFGEADYTIDLQAALSAIDQSKRAYSRMSPEVRKIYPTWQKFVNGMNSGDLARDLERIEKEKAAPAGNPAVATEVTPKAN